jgi:hypothetical protein
VIRFQYSLKCKVTCLFLTVIFLGACVSSQTTRVAEITKNFQPTKWRIYLLPSRVGPLQPCPQRQTLRKQYSKGSPYRLPVFLIDNHLAAKYKLIQAERDRWRATIVAERKARAEVQNYYNKTLAKSLAELDKQRSWFERNKGLIGFVVGTLFASAMAIGLAFAINEVGR